MPSTYTNDLRIEEQATGENSGTWGTKVNSAFSQIAEAFSYGTQDCFSSDADATTTVADGATDPARAMYFKVTSSATLTATRTLTIAPNTISRVMFIENATTGSQSIAISQGSGANVTIGTGKTKVVYLDGAGATAAVVDAMAKVDPGVNDTLAEILAAGNTSGGTGLTMSSGDDLTLTGANYNVVWDSSADALEFADNAKAVFGAGSDLQIYHDSNNSYIVDSGTGNLYINANELRIANADNSKDYIHGNNGAEVKLYYNNAQKLATTSTGIDVTGVITTDGMTTSADINFGDNDKAVFGAGSDLQIYHDGSHSYVKDNGTGYLKLGVSDAGTTIQNAAGNNLVITDADKASLGYQSTLRLSTTATGIDVLGTVTTDGLTVDGTATISAASPTLTFTDTDTGADTILNAASSVGSFQINVDANDEGSAPVFTTAISGSEYFRITESSAVFNENSADVDFRVESDNNSHMLFVDAGNDRIGIGQASSPSAKLHINSGTDNEVIRLESTDTEAFIHLKDSTGSSFIKGRGDLRFEVGSADVVQMLSGETVVNNGSNDYDFRVESDTKANAIFVNAGTDEVNFDGARTNFGGITAETADGEVNLGLIKLRNSNTTSGEFLSIDAEGTSAGQNMTHYWYDGSYRNRFSVAGNTGETTVNDSSADIDFRVESDTNANAIFMNAGQGITYFGHGNTMTGNTFNFQANVLNGFSIGSSNAVYSVLSQGGQDGDLYLVSNAYPANLGSTRNVIIQGGTSGGSSPKETARFNPENGVIFNEQSIAAHDFRVESNSNTHMLFVDSGANSIGINNSSPSSVKLSVLGASTAAVGWGDVSDRGFLSFDGSGNPIVRAGSSLDLKFQANGSRDVATFGQTATVFNEPGNDQDFRVESDTNANAFVVDASQDKVYVGANQNVENAIFNVYGAKNTASAQIPQGNMGSTDTTAMAEGVGGSLIFNGKYTTGGDYTNFASIEGNKLNATTGNYSGKLVLRSRTHGANNNERASFSETEAVFNDDSLDVDFRVESNNNANLFVVNAGTDRVGFGTNNPSASVEIVDIYDVNGSDVFVTAKNTNASRQAGFGVNDESGSNRLLMKYDNGSNVASISNPADGALAIYLGGTGAANALDDYEEGTWTPTYTATTTNPTISGYSIQVGKYTKIGDTVHAWARLRTNAVTVQGAGGLAISGLPFTAVNISNLFGIASIGYTDVWDDANAPSAGYVTALSTVCRLKKYASADARDEQDTDVDAGDLDTGATGQDILIVITYKTD